jgi:phosphoglucosamine mutase
MLKYFGTDGVRGLANKDLTAEMAYRIGRCLATMKKDKKPRILICRDTRLSSDMLKAALLAGLLSSGAEVFDEGVSSTPSISYLVRKKCFDYGVMISASHNPFGDNGIKIFNGEGEKLDDDSEELIEAYMDKKEDDLPLPTGKELGRCHKGTSLKKEYLAWLRSKAKASFYGLKVLVDCANGSTSLLAPTLFRSLGIKASYIHADPDGVNINEKCGSTHLESLTRAFKKGHYDFGFAFDGDGDRFMALSKSGQLIDGDAQIYLHALEFEKEGILTNHKAVMTVMSNLALRQGLEKEGIGYEVVAVGDKYVQAEMKKDGLKVGGEQSGHVIFLDDLNTGDGLLSAIKLMNLYKQEPDVYAKLDSFHSFPQYLLNIKFDSKEKLEAVASSRKLTDASSEEEKNLNKEGRVLVRASGTEPLLRIMVEAKTDKICHEVASRLETLIKEI